MVDWKNPQTIRSETVTFNKLNNVCCGMYLLEYVSTLDFEWKIVTRKKGWRWPMSIYLLCRLTALASILTDLVVLNTTTELNCSAALGAELVFGYLSAACASALIMLRTVAIWNRNNVISIIACCLSLTNVAFCIFGGIEGPISMWNSSFNACVQTHSNRNKINFMVGFLTDNVNLALSLVGLWRQRESRGGFWSVLYRQGIAWIAGAIVFYCLPTVFLFINFNDAMNLMFEIPSLVGLVICATRMYRGLYDYDNKIVSYSFSLSNIRSTRLHFRSSESHENDNNSTAYELEEFHDTNQLPELGRSQRQET